MPLTGDSRRSSRSGRGSPRASGLSTWLSASSGSPTGPTDTLTFSPSSPSPASLPREDLISTSNPENSLSPTRLQHSRTNSADSPTSTSRPSMPAPASRLAFFTTSISTAVSRLRQPAPISPTTDDEILSMDIERALFPSGGPPDTFSPAAFKNLQMAATAVLTKVQAAYRQRTAMLHELQEEAGAQGDELDESRTRVEHLRQQLDGMATREAAREQEIARMRDELESERRARMVGEQRLAEVLMAGQRNGEKGQLHPPPEGSVVSEDLGVGEEQRRHRRWRKSGGSYDTDEEESVGDAESSVFSRSRSPTIIQGGVLDGSGVSHPRVAALGQPGGPTSISATPFGTGVNGRHRPPSSPATQPMTTFQKLVKGVTGTRAGPEDEDYLGSGRAGAEGCQNCLGQDSNFAWNTVSLLRDENRHLKHRVGELETAVDTALDLADGIGLEPGRT